MRFFRISGGRAPIEESLRGMGTADRGELTRKLKALEAQGHEAFKNRIKPLGEGLFELKWGSFRVLFVFEGGEPMLMDAFIKKSKAEQTRIIARTRKWLGQLH